MFGICRYNRGRPRHPASPDPQVGPSSCDASGATLQTLPCTDPQRYKISPQKGKDVARCLGVAFAEGRLMDKMLYFS